MSQNDNMQVYTIKKSFYSKNMMPYWVLLCYFNDNVLQIASWPNKNIGEPHQTLPTQEDESIENS